MAKIMYIVTSFFVLFFVTGVGAYAESNSIFASLNPKRMYADYVKKNEQLNSGEIPPFCKSGHYEHGRYTQITVDTKGAIAAGAFGLLVRFLYSCGHFGTKLETIKSAILIPGCAKSALFWGGSCLVYQYVIKNKERESSKQKNQELLNQLQKQGNLELLNQLKNVPAVQHDTPISDLNLQIPKKDEMKNSNNSDASK